MSKSLTTYDSAYWRGYLDRKAREHGARWDDRDLQAARHFAPYLHSNIRIKVRNGLYGAVRTGTVGITTGWRPAFLLMSRSSAHGSSDVLGPHDVIVGVLYGRTYRPTELHAPGIMQAMNLAGTDPFGLGGRS